MYSRYGVFFVPQGDLVARRAARLGWGLARGFTVAPPDLPGVDVDAITIKPQNKGFMAPSSLAPGAQASGFARAFCGLSAALHPVEIPGLELKASGRFLALTPVGRSDALGKIAAQVVTPLDGFRARLTPVEVSRRRPSNLMPVHEQNLLDWGYLYVLDEFRFHITLTDRLAPLA